VGAEPGTSTRGISSVSREKGIGGGQSWGQRQPLSASFPHPRPSSRGPRRRAQSLAMSGGPGLVVQGGTAAAVDHQRARVFYGPPSSMIGRSSPGIEVVVLRRSATRRSSDVIFCCPCAWDDAGQVPRFRKKRLPDRISRFVPGSPTRINVCVFVLFSLRTTRTRGPRDSGKGRRGSRPIEQKTAPRSPPAATVHDDRAGPGNLLRQGASCCFLARDDQLRAACISARRGRGLDALPKRGGTRQILRGKTGKPTGPKGYTLIPAPRPSSD